MIENVLGKLEWNSTTARIVFQKGNDLSCYDGVSRVLSERGRRRRRRRRRCTVSPVEIVSCTIPGLARASLSLVASYYLN